jgi:hypothetical protein
MFRGDIGKPPEVSNRKPLVRPSMNSMILAQVPFVVVLSDLFRALH